MNNILNDKQTKILCIITDIISFLQTCSKAYYQDNFINNNDTPIDYLLNTNIKIKTNKSTNNNIKKYQEIINKQLEKITTIHTKIFKDYFNKLVNIYSTANSLFDLVDNDEYYFNEKPISPKLWTEQIDYNFNKWKIIIESNNEKFIKSNTYKYIKYMGSNFNDINKDLHQFIILKYILLFKFNQKLKIITHNYSKDAFIISIDNIISNKQLDIDMTINDLTKIIKQKDPYTNFNDSSINNILPEVAKDITYIAKNLPDVPKDPPLPAKNLPEVSKDLPEVSKDLPEVSKDLPEVSKDLPEVAKDLSDVDKNLPDVDKNLPDVLKDLPKIAKDTRAIPKNMPNSTKHTTYAAKVIQHVSKDNYKVTKDISKNITDSQNNISNIPQTTLQYTNNNTQNINNTIPNINENMDDDMYNTLNNNIMNNQENIYNKENMNNTININDGIICMSNDEFEKNINDPSYTLHINNLYMKYGINLANNIYYDVNYTDYENYIIKHLSNNIAEQKHIINFIISKNNYAQMKNIYGT